MKTLILLFCFLSCSVSSFALPVVNVNVAPPGAKALVWPDHENKKKFYVVPRGYEIVSDYHWGFKIRKNDEVMMAFQRYYDQDEKFSIEYEMRKIHGWEAEVSEIIPDSEVINLAEFLDPFFYEKNCRNSHPDRSFMLKDIAFHCDFKLTLLGKEKLVPFLMEHKSLALNASVEFRGYIQHSNDQLQTYVLKMALPLEMKRPLEIIDWP